MPHFDRTRSTNDKFGLTPTEFAVAAIGSGSVWLLEVLVKGMIYAVIIKWMLE
jgi:hypothetical protein